MRLTKSMIKMYVYLTFCLFALVGFVLGYNYFRCVQVVEDVVPQLVTIVARDNCLDDTVDLGGTTMYKNFRSHLDAIDASNPNIEFRSDAISVSCTSVESAPQKGSIINCTIRGYWVITLPLAGGIQIDFPIERTVPVFGTHYYRDR